MPESLIKIFTKFFVEVFTELFHTEFFTGFFIEFCMWLLKEFSVESYVEFLAGSLTGEGQVWRYMLTTGCKTTLFGNVSPSRQSEVAQRRA